MKIFNTLLFITFFFISFQLSAQQKWNFGLNISQSFGGNIATEKILEDGSPIQISRTGLRQITGTSISILGRRSNLVNWLDLDVGAGYLLNYRSVANNTVEWENNHFLFLNVTPKFRLGEKWYFTAGLEGRYQLDKVELKNPWNVSGIIGLEYRPNDRMNFYLNYKGSFVPFNRHITDEFTRVSHYNRGLEIGVTFFLGKKR